MRCIRCNRPLKHGTATGMGDVCARKARAQAPQAVERDLFGYDIAGAVEAARERSAVRIAVATVEAHMAVRCQFRAARERLLGWRAPA